MYAFWAWGKKSDEAAKAGTARVKIKNPPSIKKSSFFFMIVKLFVIWLYGSTNSNQLLLTDFSAKKFDREATCGNIRLMKFLCDRML